MPAEFNLPGSSFDELKKIILAYANYPNKVSGDDVGRLAGVHRTTVSRNSKFLVDAGLISGGAQKAATDLGRKLARSIEHNVSEDEAASWAESVAQNEKFSNLITTLRIKQGMTEKAFSDHILYVSGEKNTSANKTGARTVVEVLLRAKLIVEADGNLTVVRSEQHEPPVSGTDEEDTEVSVSDSSKKTQKSPLEGTPTSSLSLSPNPQVTINIQLHLPEATDPETYERLFKALSENLFPPKNV